LSDDKKGHYNHLVRSLEERFAPPNQMELYRVQLKERKQRASESLPELRQGRKFEGGKAHLPTVENNDIETSKVVNNLASKIEDMYKTMNEQLANIKKELDEVKKK
jgi:hypothetical protein